MKVNSTLEIGYCKIIHIWNKYRIVCTSLAKNKFVYMEFNRKQIFKFFTFQKLKILSIVVDRIVI